MASSKKRKLSAANHGRSTARKGGQENISPQTAHQSTNNLKESLFRKGRAVLAWIPRTDQRLREKQCDGKSQQSLSSNDDEKNTIGPSSLNGRAISVGETDEKRCVPLVPTPPLYSSSFDENDSMKFPSFQDLVNHPQYCGGQQGSEDTKMCVMCGIECPSVKSRKDLEHKKDRAIVPQDKSVCTICQELVWRNIPTNIEFRWCRSCHNFLPWPLFCRENKVMAKGCNRCRDKRIVRTKTSTPTNGKRCVLLWDLSLQDRLSVVEESASVPHIRQLANFDFVGQHEKNGCKVCVMCGAKCTVLKSPSESKNEPFILAVDKSICNMCRKVEWVFMKDMLHIKWCDRCHVFQSKASFCLEHGVCLVRRKVLKDEEGDSV